MPQTQNRQNQPKPEVPEVLTETPIVEDPTIGTDLVLIAFDPSADPDITATRFGVTVLSEAVMGDGKKQLVPSKQLWLEMGLQYITEMEWRSLAENPQPHVKKALQRDAIFLIEAWTELNKDEKRNAIRLCLSASSLEILQKWRRIEKDAVMLESLDRQIAKISKTKGDDLASVRSFSAN